jgi:hypothetical protein
MKTTIKLILVVCIFSSVTFADGEMTNGGKTCTGNCFVAPEPTETVPVKPETNNYFLKFVQKYLISIFG